MIIMSDLVKIVNKCGIEKVVPLRLAIKMRKQNDITGWIEMDTKEEVKPSVEEIQQKEDELIASIEDVREEYFKKFQKKVPNNKINDREWIEKKINS